MTEDPPSPWDLQRQLDRVELSRVSDMDRILKMHQEDRAEMMASMQLMGERLERTIRETAGVPLGTWTAHNTAVDIELKNLRERVESVQRLVVGTLLTMIAGGIAVAVLTGAF